MGLGKSHWIHRHATSQPHKSEGESNIEIEGEQESESEVGVDTEERGREEEAGLESALHNDCEVLLRSDLTDAQKLELALNFSQYNPSPTSKFPTTVEYGKKRSFQYRYLTCIHGLVNLSQFI